MKTKIVSVWIALALMATVAFGQSGELRIPLKGNAYAVGAAGAAGLEIGGKLVVPKNYASFQTDGNGTLFAVEAKDGKWGVVNRSGVFIYKCTYYKAQITGDLIRLQATAGGAPKFYNVKTPTVEVKVTKADPWMFEPETHSSQRRAMKKAKVISQKYPYSAIEFREGANGALELWMNGEFDLKEYKRHDDTPVAVPVSGGKKLFEAKNFYLISNYAYFEKTTAWIFAVEEMGMGRRLRGIFTLYVYKDKVTGKKGVDTYMSVPFGYESISACREHVAVCHPRGGTNQFFNWATGEKANYSECGSFKADVDPLGRGKLTYASNAVYVDMCMALYSGNNETCKFYFYRSQEATLYKSDVVVTIAVPQGSSQLEAGTYKPSDRAEIVGKIDGNKISGHGNGTVTITVDGEIYTISGEIVVGGRTLLINYKGELNVL